MKTDAGPSFRKPPVVETALSIQFDELRSLRTTHFGMYYATVKDRFPVVEDKPRIEPVIESFPRVPRMPTLRIGPASGGPDRVLFTESADGSMMLQLQPDRFAFNWCRKEGQEYPRYDSNLPRLLKEFDQFCDFAAGQGLGEVKPNLCEVTYVNHIHPIENETPTDCFAAIFSGLRWESSDEWLPQPPDVVTLNRVFTLGEN
ncbi:MAG: TIGR04255 family protein, partial [Planctomycetes bacterium]|nr:TIGR04255 family protein [Planctomycetota bacterium]